MTKTAYVTAGYARLFRRVHVCKLPGVPPGSLSFCDAREVAKAHVAAADHGRVGELYLHPARGTEARGGAPE